MVEKNDNGKIRGATECGKLFKVFREGRSTLFWKQKVNIKFSREAGTTSAIATTWAYHFGANDIYKEVKVRIAKAWGLAKRSFKLELGNNEGINDMKRQYETQIDIKPVSYNAGFESGIESATILTQFASETKSSPKLSLYCVFL